jgi:hypothetical protein
VQITREYFQNTPRDLNGCVPRDSSQKCINPGHEHPDWTTDYDAGNMDGFCHQYTNSGQCPSVFLCSAIRRGALFRHRDELRLRELHVPVERGSQLPLQSERGKASKGL